MTKIKLDSKDVLHVAKLSNLKLTKKEIKKFTPQLAKIVDFISELSEVDTKDLKPTSQTTGLSNVFKKDEVKNERMLTQDEVLSGTENTHNGFIKVTAILTNRTNK